MVDTSPPLGMANTGPVQPVKEYFFVADHHADPDEVEENCRAQGVRRVKLAFVGLPVGSTSAFMAALALAFGVLEELGRRRAAPRPRSGIYTDTSALLHGATALDFRMFEKLTRDEDTQEMLDELRDYRVPPEWFDYRARRVPATWRRRAAVRIAPVGYVREDHRDVIAEIANELLRIEGTSIGIAVAVTEHGHRGLGARRQPAAARSDRERIVRVIDHLLEYAFPGVSGLQVRAPAAAPRGGRRLRAARRGPAAAVEAGHGATSGPGGRADAVARLRARDRGRAQGPEVRAPGGDPGTDIEAWP